MPFGASGACWSPRCRARGKLAADRGATALLGGSASLASALDALGDDVPSAPDRDAREAALASLSVVPDEREGPGPALTYEGRRPICWGLRLPVRRVLRWVNERYVHPALATHPATAERIDCLRDLERQHVTR